MSRLQKGDEKQDAVDDELLCFVTEGSPNKNAAQYEHREAVSAFSDKTEVETWTEYNTSSSVLGVKKGLVTTDPLTMEELLQAQREDGLCTQRSASVGEPQPCFNYDQ